MLIVICSIFLVLILIGIVLILVGNWDDLLGCRISGILMVILFGIGILTSSTILFEHLADIATEHTIDEKIIMYEEESAKIEEKIKIAIENYLGHEENTLTNLTPENAVTILAKYPELKADTLIASQIETYISNSEKIISLKEEKIDITKKKWWAYFGS